MTVAEAVPATQTPPPRITLMVREPGRRVAVLTFSGTRFLMGRSPHADLPLRQHSISREHAEIFVDPTGLWHVRDLKSRNGTFLNGKRVTEQTLADGDCIRIKDTEVVFAITTRPVGEAVSSRTVIEDSLGTFKTVQEAEGATISGSQLKLLLDLADDLRKTAEMKTRLGVVCAALAQEPMGGGGAMILRIRPDRPMDPAEVVAEAGNVPPGLGISHSVLVRLISGTRAVLADSGPGVPDDSPAGDGPTATVAVVLDGTPGRLDLLYWVLPAERATPQALLLGAAAGRIADQSYAAWMNRR